MLVSAQASWLALAPIAVSSHSKSFYFGAALISGISGLVGFVASVVAIRTISSVNRLALLCFGVTALGIGIEPIVSVATLGQFGQIDEVVTGTDYFRLPVLACLAIGLSVLTPIPGTAPTRGRLYIDAFITTFVISFMVWSLVGISGGPRWSGNARVDLFQNAPILLDSAVLSAVAVMLFTPVIRGRLSLRLISHVGLAGLLLLVSHVLVPVISDAEWAFAVDSLLFTVAPLLLGIAVAVPRPLAQTGPLPLTLSLGGQVLTSGAATIVLLLILAEVRLTGNVDQGSIWIASCLLVFVLIRHGVSWLEGVWLTNALEEKVVSNAEALGNRDRLFQSLVWESSDLIVVIAEDGTFDYTSPSVSAHLGYPQEWLDRARFLELVSESDRNRSETLLEMASKQPGVVLTARWSVDRVDGEPRLFDVNVRNLLHDHAVNGYVLNLRDITEKKQLENRLVHQALHDDLTGLANRSFLRVHVERALTRWVFQREPFSVLILNIDGFREYNETQGHVTGDAILKEVAERLQRCTRRGDTVVRLTGDEFGTLIHGVYATDEEARYIVQRMQQAIREPIQIDGRTIMVRASMGFACVSDDVQQVDDILRNADLALHAAKTNARGEAKFFEASMHDVAIYRADLEREMRDALSNDEFQLFYQPTCDVRTGRLSGFEALLRWPHPERGYVSPADFIPVAERSGLIVPLGEWVLKQACNQMVQWQGRFSNLAGLHMNVNLSAYQLDQDDVVEMVVNTVNSAGIRPSSVVLEMTESVLSENEKSTMEKLNTLSEAGFSIAIDDFGTGYSSLSYIRKFPVNILKIDRSFVSEIGLPGNGDQEAMVKAIIDLARTLGVTTVAEGVETMEQLLKLRELGCDIGQGFFMARPMAASDVRKLIESTVARGRPLVSYTGTSASVN